MVDLYKDIIHGCEYKNGKLTINKGVYYKIKRSIFMKIVVQSKSHDCTINKMAKEKVNFFDSRKDFLLVKDKN